MNRRDLEMHLQDLFEGCLAVEDFHSLQEELRANPQARAAYREYLHLHHALRFRSKGVDMLRVVPMDKVVERGQRRMMKQAGLAAAALIIVTATVMALVLAIPDKPTLTFTSTPGTDLIVSHNISGEEIPDGQALEPGSRLVMTHGAVELEFASGVRGIVRGPADITLLREDLLDLAQGTVWFHVPRNAVGFQVRTPRLVLTDLGTKFGIISKPGALDEVHVFSGKVEILNSKGLKKQEVLEEGQARKAGPAGRWSNIPLRRDHFLTKLPSSVKTTIFLNDSVSFTTSPENEMIKETTYTFSSGAELSGFDLGKSDKLVATFSHENASIAEVTYGGVRMAPAVRSNTPGLRQTAIYYLDSPGSAGDLVVSFEGVPNGVGGSLLALSNTALGAPVATTAAAGRSVQVTSPDKNAFLVVSHVSNDHLPNASPTARDPMIPLFGGPVGSSAGGSGYMKVGLRGKVIATFSSSGGDPVTVGAVFAPHP